MKETVEEIKEKFPDAKVLIGGAPVNENFKNKIGADFYGAEPKKLLSF